MRIIQDSEDEDGLEIEDAQVLAGHAPPQHISSPGGKGTGSTESLKRAIVAAHRSQFRDDSSDKLCRSNPSEEPSAADVSDVSKVQEVPQLSGSSIGRDNTHGKTSLDDAAVLWPARDLVPGPDEPHTEQALNNLNTRSGSMSERPWHFQGTLRDDWEHHEPMGLFAQTVSSTIPNATATQELLLAEVLAPEFLQLDPEPESDKPKYEPARSSVPWSEYLKSSSRGPEVPAQPSEQIPFISQNTTSGSAGDHTGRPLSCPSREESPDPLHAPLEERTIDLVVKTSESSLKGSIHCSALTASGEASPILSSVPNSEDDLIAMDVPVEQYKPRPSRSRSLKSKTQDPIDYSQRPERIAKRTRRTRTAGEVDTASTATTPEKIRQICDMGFSRPMAKKALRQHNGDITHTVGWLVARNIPAESNLSSPKPSNSENKKPYIRLDDEDTTEADAHAGGSKDAAPVAPPDASSATGFENDSEPAVTTSDAKSPVVKVVIPGTRKQMDPYNDWTKETTASTPLHLNPESVPEESAKSQQEALADAPSEEQVATTQQPPRGKKRGRGRPRKETKTIESNTEDINDDTTQHDATKKVADEQPKNTAHSSDEPVDPVTNPSIPNMELACEIRNINEDEKVDRTTPEPRPPPEKKVKQSSEAPSSIGKGKTTHYRVGLSKRARIAPLLRIVKK